METLSNGFTLDIPPGCFPLGTDSMALAWFARLPKNARVLDLGSGCGALGLLLCARRADIAVTGVELTETAHQAALENIRRNGLSSRMESVCADARSVSGLFSPGRFSCCLSNPPYFSGGPKSRETPLARRSDYLSIRELMEAAAWAVKFGGDFFLVHRPEMLGELMAQGGRAGFAAKRLCLVRHRAEGPVSLVLLQLRKGGKPGLTWEEICLYSPEGAPTAAFREIYSIEEA